MKKDYYRKNSEEYIKESLSYDMSVFYRYIEKTLSKLNGKPNILDLGFGSGRDMKYIENLGFNVKGIDSCENFIENALKEGLNVIHSELPDFGKCKEKFDLIYSVGLIMHLNEKERITLFKELKKRLNKNGLFVVSYNTLNRSNDKEREFYTLSIDQIRNELEMVLIDVEIMEDKRGFQWVTETYSL